MDRRRCGVLAALCLVYAVSSQHSASGGDVESARCRVRCLAHLKHHLGGLRAQNSNTQITFARCFEDPACTACLKPCGQPLAPLAQCFQLCQKQEDDCEQSCRFLKHVETVRPGTCPPPEDESGEGKEGTCIVNCDADPACDGTMKCCDTGCGYTCQTPLNINIGVPDIPSVLEIRERSKGGSVELTWSQVYMNFSAPLLYMVQHRWNVGRHHSEHHMTQWHQVSQTTQTSTVLRDVGPGRWYEYRVSAVSVNGSQGFSEPSNPFKVSKEPSAPGPPQNLSEGETRVQNNKVHVTVTWRPPKKSDLPVSRYKVYWSKRLKSASAQLVSLREHKKALPGDQLSFELQNLIPDTTYFVQVMAISQYGDIRLKGERTSMYITTYALPQATQHEGLARSSGAQSRVSDEQTDTESGRTDKPVPVRPRPPPVQNLTVNAPYFQNGLLKANVTWAPPAGYETCFDKSLIHWTAEVCIADPDDEQTLAKSMSATTHEFFFLIYDLQFDCRYFLKVQPVCEDGMIGPIAHVGFKTPSCGEVEVQGTVQPDCPTNMPRVPDAPPSLAYTFLIKQTNITARVNWREPQSDAPITGYRIVWGQTVESQDDTSLLLLDQNTALTKVLSTSAALQGGSKNYFSFNVGSLLEATTYLVKVQAISKAGSGQVSSIQFTTPMLQAPPPLGPPYKQDHQEKKSSSRNRGSIEEPGEQPAANVVILGGRSSSISTPQHRTSIVVYSVFSLVFTQLLSLSLT